MGGRIEKNSEFKNKKLGNQKFTLRTGSGRTVGYLGSMGLESDGGVNTFDTFVGRVVPTSTKMGLSENVLLGDILQLGQETIPLEGTYLRSENFGINGLNLSTKRLENNVEPLLKVNMNMVDLGRIKEYRLFREPYSLSNFRSDGFRQREVSGKFSEEMIASSLVGTEHLGVEKSFQT